MKKITCPNCGGDIENAVCIYCRLPIKKEDMEFYSNIDDYIKKYNDIRLKFEKGINLTLEEDEIFKTLLKYDVISDNELDDRRIIYWILTRRKVISYDTFELVMKRATEKNMRNLSMGRIPHYKPCANIMDLKDNNGSAISHYIVNLDTQIVRNLYEGSVKSLVTYYHEIEHISQSMAFELGYVSEDIIDMIKDKVIKEDEYLSYGTRYYYTDNYISTSYEIKAEQEGINQTEKLLNELHLEVPNGYFDILRLAWPRNLEDKSRIVRIEDKKEKKNLDDIFIETIKDKPIYLKKYPQLTLLYIEDNGTVRPRIKEELDDVLEYFKDDEVIAKYVRKVINSLISDPIY